MASMDHMVLLFNFLDLDESAHSVFMTADFSDYNNTKTEEKWQ